MLEPARISVVIPAYNAERFLERAVESVFATGDPAVDVVIVDDGSTDGTAAVAEQLCRARPNRCRTLQHPGQANLGVSASRNLGIRFSDSEWVALLDADDYYLPNRFHSLRRFLAERRAFDAIYELTEIRGEGADPSPSPDPERLFGIRAALTGPALLRELLQGRCWATSAITMRRALLDKTGLFDVAKRIAEDCDLWFRMAAIGAVVPGELRSPVSVYWRHGQNTYNYQLGHRVAMVLAMLDAWRWTERSGGNANQAVFENEVPRYFLRSMHACREAGNHEVRSSLIRTALRSGRAHRLVGTAVLRQIATLLIDRIRPQATPR